MGEKDKTRKKEWDDITKVPAEEKVEPFLRTESGEEIPVFDKRGGGRLGPIKKLSEQGPNGQCVVQVGDNRKATFSPSIIPNNKTKTLFRLI